MPYVIRDQDGHVVGMAEVPLDDAAELVAPDNSELLALLTRTCGAEVADEDQAFLHSDLAFIRVLEDLIEVLIRRGVITLGDLPVAAQEKVMQRRALRHWLAGSGGLVDDEGR